MACFVKVIMRMSAAASLVMAEAMQAQRRPHIVVVMADDLGWSGAGFNLQPEQRRTHSQWVQTPKLDELARSGVLLKRHYAGKSCAPSRSSFMSGRFPVHVNQENPPIEQPFTGVPLDMSTIADVLSEQGYETYHIGKWHLGMHSEELLPYKRGFNHSLAMLGGSMDYFNFSSGWVAKKKMTDLWLNDKPASYLIDAAYGFEGQCEHYSVRGSGPAAQCKPYATSVFMNYALDKIRHHNKEKPMFMFLALQNVHGPHQVPTRFLDLYSPDEFPADSPRRYGYAMISALDEAMGHLTEELVKKGMWDDTLFLFTSDNGGKYSEAPNYPLRGGKGSVFEGGVRVASFVTGGFLPKEVRGRWLDGLMHICDWWATFAGLAGVSGATGSGFMDPKSAKSWSIPARAKQVDSLDMWPYISGTAQESPRKVVHLSHDAGKGGMIVGRWKFIIGSWAAFHPQVTSPDDLSGDDDITIHTCGNADEGCLFDLESDEREENDLRSSSHHHDILQAVRDIYMKTSETYYQSYFAEGKEKPLAKDAAMKNGNIWTPWKRSLPPKAMTDRKLNGQKLPGARYADTLDAQECYDKCQQDNTCRGWQFKPGSCGKDTEDENCCILFEFVFHNAGSIKEVPEFISGIKNDDHISMIDDVPWLNMNVEASSISQDNPLDRQPLPSTTNTAMATISTSDNPLDRQPLPSTTNTAMTTISTRTTVTTSATTKVGSCLSWCAENTNEWATKCKWNSCKQCAECQAEEQEEEEESENCQEWCPNNSDDWDTKCTWKSCRKCSACSKDRRLHDSSATSMTWMVDASERAVLV
jgi:arylsulfatase I/J